MCDHAFACLFPVIIRNWSKLCCDVWLLYNDQTYLPCVAIRLMDRLDSIQCEDIFTQPLAVTPTPLNRYMKRHEGHFVQIYWSPVRSGKSSQGLPLLCVWLWVLVEDHPVWSDHLVEEFIALVLWQQCRDDILAFVISRYEGLDVGRRLPSVVFFFVTSPLDLDINIQNDTYVGTQLNRALYVPIW